ncbi:hypothetical protein [Lentzea albida]|nr:hypothetical protein [Lentzea albida]
MHRPVGHPLGLLGTILRKAERDLEISPAVTKRSLTEKEPLIGLAS